MPFMKKRQTALNVLIIIFAAVLLLYGVRIVDFQFVSAEKYVSQGSGYSTRTSVIKAERGEILDCYGREIAINRDGYNITLNYAYIDFVTINDTILKITDYLTSVGEDWNDELPLTPDYPYSFTEEDNTLFLKKIGLAHYASAENAFLELTERFSLQPYSDEEKRILMGVRYSMLAADFSVANPYTLSEDVSVEVMQHISESNFLLKGVTVETVPVRQYVDTSFAPNIIGSTGPIFAEDWEKYKEKGYSYSDKVGKSGIEAYAEDDLRGKDGLMTYVLDDTGTVVSSTVTQEPVPGKTVILTLNKAIQKDTGEALESIISSLKSEGGSVTGGAAVVMNVNTGEIIASANNPTYDLSTLSENYNQLLNDKSNPLLDRAFQGVYPIGSTIKPAVAVAGIDTNVLNAEETITCVKTYRLFQDYQPNCMGTHGSINLKTALSKSCNYYFFEVGRRVGAKQLTQYFKNFGLGVPTGVEIDDSAGILADVSQGSGDTLQIAIGQMNAFTPLQLAVYTSTLANGGTKYKATLIKKVVSHDTKTVYTENSAEVLGNMTISDYALSSVKSGMLSVVEEGTGSYVMKDYPIKIGGKTGTSQNTGADHSVYIAFAPFENPEIAISVVLEHGSSGRSAGQILRAILDGYFFTDNTSADKTQPYTALK